MPAAALVKAQMRNERSMPEAAADIAPCKEVESAWAGERRSTGACKNKQAMEEAARGRTTYTCGSFLALAGSDYEQRQAR
jgi:hypothetical protein